MGGFYTKLVQMATVTNLTEMGFLVPAIYYGGKTPDLARVKTIGGDWNMLQASDRCSNQVLLGDLLANWMRLAGDRHTIIFCCDIRHAHAAAARFINAGIPAACITDKTPLNERDEIMERFRSRQIQVLCNVQVLTYGVDVPSVSCIVLARPTKSIVLQGPARNARAELTGRHS